jgi:hypothetical protein
MRRLMAAAVLSGIILAACTSSTPSYTPLDSKPEYRMGYDIGYRSGFEAGAGAGWNASRGSQYRSSPFADWFFSSYPQYR